MFRRITAFVFLTAIGFAVGTEAGPYAPPAGQSGSTAMLYDTNLFAGWATGWTNYLPGSTEGGTNGFAAKWKNPLNALGQADAWNTFNPVQIVSLGGGGEITLLFDPPITDGSGYDFAVFENAVSEGFLELAWVEVSSDGQHFVRFPNISLTAQSVDAYALTNEVDATDIDGLASKYVAGYGTPFDLHDVAGSNAFVDVTRITHVRIRDIVGNGSCSDSAGHPIYDPYPTSGSPGFDLDAVGVINTPVEWTLISSTCGCMEVRWHASSNRFYQAEWSSNPGGQWNHINGVVTGANQQVSLMDTNMDSGMKYYRLMQWKEP